MRACVCLLITLTGTSILHAQSDAAAKHERRPDSSQHAATKDAPPREPKKRLDVKKLLAARVESVELANVTLEQAMEWVAERLDTTVYIRWQALTEAGFEPDKRITVKGRRLPLNKVLWIIMQEFKGTTKTKLAYRATGDLFVFSTHDDLSQEMIVMAYYTKDLAMVIPDFIGAGDSRDRPRVISEPIPDFDFKSTGGRTRTLTRFISANEEQLLKLIQVIKTSIEPESWDINGGKGTIEYFENNIVVRNSIHVHKMLGGVK